MLEDNLRRLFSIIFFLITIVIILLAVLTNPQIYSGLPRKNEKLPDETYLGNIETIGNYKIYDQMSL